MGDGPLEQVCSFSPLVPVDREGDQRGQIGRLDSTPTRTRRGSDKHEDDQEEEGRVTEANHGNRIEPSRSTGDRLKIGNEDLLAQGKFEKAVIPFDEEYEKGPKYDERCGGSEHYL